MGGNVGIGTTAPSYQLQDNANILNAFAVSTTGGGVKASIDSNGVASIADTLKAGIGISSSGLGRIAGNLTINADTGTVLASKSFVSNQYIPKGSSDSTYYVGGDNLLKKLPSYLRYVSVRCVAKGTAVTVGTNIAGVYESQFGGTILRAGAYVDSAGTGGAKDTINILKAGTTIFSTKITIDSAEVSTYTAAVPSVLSTTTIAEGDRLSFDVNYVPPTPPKGLVIWLEIRPYKP